MNAVSKSQAAKVAGILYLLMTLTGLFAELYVPSRLIIQGDTAATARNITSSYGLFRIGIVSDLVTCFGDVVLILALYALLCRVSKGLAIVASFLRLVESAICGFSSLRIMHALRLLSGPGYWQAL